MEIDGKRLRFQSHRWPKSHLGGARPAESAAVGPGLLQIPLEPSKQDARRQRHSFESDLVT